MQHTLVWLARLRRQGHSFGTTGWSNDVVQVRLAMCVCVRSQCRCAGDESDGDDMASLARGLSRECRIVLVSGFESFNVDLYRKARTW